MTSIDEIFKNSNFNGSKRKFEAPAQLNQHYKSAKLSTNGDVKGKVHGNQNAKVESDPEDEEEAGPELPPDGPEDQVDDEEGRFFGGGVNRQTADALDYVEGQDEQEVVEEKYDKAWLRRLALNFERKINKNAELRAKYEDDPQKFIESEADLDAEIKMLSTLTDHAELYEEFVKLGCAGSLASLLAHDNTDIAIGAITVIAELVDDDVEIEQGQWDALVKALFEADLPGLLLSNLERLDESSEEDRSGVYQSLSLLENLASNGLVVGQLAAESSILDWLLARIQKSEKLVGQNKQYSAEVLSIFLQSSSKVRMTAISKDAIDVHLQLLATYRNRDPSKGSEEEEYAENIFDSLICLVDDPEDEESVGKTAFLNAEGVELCLIMIQEGSFSKPRGLRLLDHAAGGTRSTAAIKICERIIEAAGLKSVFQVFSKSTNVEELEHTIGIFASLLRLLPGESAPRIRLLGKFVEKNYKHCKKLVKLRGDYTKKVGDVDRRIEKERQQLDKDQQDEQEGEWLSRRLDAGLFCLQTIDFVLAWLVAEDSGSRTAITEFLEGQDESLDSVRRTLETQLDDLDTEDTAGADSTTADVLRTLIDFLKP